MKNNLLIEMFPLLIFFAIYYFSKNIFYATSFCILASWLQIGYYLIFHKKVPKGTLLSTGLITIFGGLTVLLHNKTFVMIKPSILYWIFAGGLLISNKVGKNSLKLLLKDQLHLKDVVWEQLNTLWIGFFTFMGVLNLVVAYYCSEYFWVKFKVFGGIGLMLFCTIISGIIIYLNKKTD